MKISELKGKHDHALTSWLKVIIFSLLMIAPLFASISQWVYVACNKNAKDSYSDNTSETIIINTTNNFNYNIDYYLTNSYLLNSVSIGNSGTNRIFIRDIEVINTNSSINFNDVKSIGFYGSGTTTYYYFYDSTNTSLGNLDSFSTFTFKVNINTMQPDFHLVVENTNSLYKIDNQNTLDNAFYYGVEKMTESDLFNWTQNTTLYTGIKTMTDNLEIQTPAIAILLTYWFILTIIYVIIDIVLKGFTTLTHLIMGAKN